jgi:GNAT superfamily N-acetyltransferase
VEATGQHRLGPHVVGQRVVVRRLVPGERGPTGGPAFTDVLGTCLAWSEGVCVVQPEEGAPVRVPVADIVSGKPVPPRPSTRLRVSPLEAQRRALALWPGLRTRPLGEWVLRHSPTSTARRANSVLALVPSGMPDDCDRVVEFYRATTGRPIAAVLPGSPEDELFRSRGWGPESDDGDTLFQLAGVAQARRALRGREGGTEVTVEEQDGLATARIGDRASGVAAYAEDWVGLRGLTVAPDHRRRGLALTVVSALLEWGAEQGATTAYLQVLEHNTPALELYARLGFRTHHAYRYLAAW